MDDRRWATGTVSALAVAPATVHAHSLQQRLVANGSTPALRLFRQHHKRPANPYTQSYMPCYTSTHFVSPPW